MEEGGRPNDDFSLERCDDDNRLGATMGRMNASKREEIKSMYSPPEDDDDSKPKSNPTTGDDFDNADPPMTMRV